MTTNETAYLPRALGRIVSTLLGATALSVALGGCATPTEPDPNPNEETTNTSEALMNNGGGGTTTTCESRWQNCYVKCGVIYGLTDPKMQTECENLCDDIYLDCTSSAHSVGRGAIRVKPPTVLAP